MKRILVEAFCDNTDRHEDTEVPAVTERTISIDSKPPSQVDVCQECSDFIDTVDALAQAGSKVPLKHRSKPGPKPGTRMAGRRSSPGPHLCPQHPGRDFGSRGKLAAHIRNVHHTSIVEWIKDGLVPAA